VSTGSGAHIIYSVGTGFPSGVRWPEREVNHSATFSAEVKNEERFVLLPYMPSWIVQGKFDITRFINLLR